MPNCLIYCVERRYEMPIINAIPNFKVHVTSSWTEFRTLFVNSSNCPLVEAEHLDDPTIYRRISSLLTDIPFVMLTLKHLNNMKVLRNFPTAHVAWLDEISHNLSKVVQGTVADLPMSRLHLEIARTHLHPDLRQALCYALEAPSPVRSQEELAEAIGKSRSTLQRLWRSASKGRREATLKKFLDWLVLMRACSIRRRSRTWSETAKILPVDRKTLNRMALRLTHEPLGPAPDCNMLLALLLEDFPFLRSN